MFGDQFGVSSDVLLAQEKTKYIYSCSPTWVCLVLSV